MQEQEHSPAEQTVSTPSAAQTRITVPQLVRALETIEAERAAQADTLTIGEAIKELGLDVTPEQVLAAVRAQTTEDAPMAAQDKAFALARKRLRVYSRSRARLRGVLIAGLLLLMAVAAHPLWLAERQTDYQSQLFIRAVRAGDLGLANMLLNEGVDPNTRGVSTNNPTLWGKIADPLHGRTPALTIAVGRGDTRMVELLLNKKADPNIRDYLGSTPLFYLAGRRTFSREDREDLSLLLTHGADLKAANDHGDTAKRYAEAVNSRPELVRALTPRGWTPG